MEKRKVALVTAAAGVGIGSSIARQLVDDGLDVVITDVHERRCGELAAELSEKTRAKVFVKTSGRDRL